MKFWNKSAILILSFAFLLRLNFALFTPNWQAADEYPHFFVIKYLSTFGNFPRSDIKFPYYEAYQPPLYYQISSVLYKTLKDYDYPSPEINQVFDPDTLVHPLNLTLFALRIFSIFTGMITLILIYGAAYYFFKNFHSVYTLLIASTLPAFVVNSSSVTNDALANLLGALLLFFLLKWFFTGQNKLYLKSILLGVLLGLSLQTKANLYPFIIVILIGLFYTKLDKKYILQNYSIIVIIAVLISLNYFLHNYKIYGSILPISPDSEKGYLLENMTFYRFYHALRNYFWSFWAAAGRTYQIHLEGYQYIILFLPLTLIAIAGNIKYLLTIKLKDSFNYGRYAFTISSIVVFALSAFYFYLLFKQHTAWGRYVYPCLGAFLIVFVFGITQMINERYQKIIFSLFFLTMLAINVIFLYQIRALLNFIS